MCEIRIYEVGIHRARKLLRTVQVFLVSAAVREKGLSFLRHVEVDLDRHRGVADGISRSEKKIVANWRITAWTVGVASNGQELQNILGYRTDAVGRNYVVGREWQTTDLSAHCLGCRRIEDLALQDLLAVARVDDRLRGCARCQTRSQQSSEVSRAFCIRRQCIYVRLP